MRGCAKPPQAAVRRINPTVTKPAVVLLSGGLDSATTAAMAQRDGYTLHALSIDYGQRHRFELDAASRVAKSLEIERHIFQRIDLSLFGGSALTDSIEVPKDRDVDEMEQGIPVTYVPARNTIFLALALACAEVVGTGDIFIGVNAVDYSGYPDCRREFIKAFEQMANYATKAAVQGSLRCSIHTPLIDLTKGEIIRHGTELGVDFALTHSCYDPNSQGISCGTCDACALRLRGFSEAGLTDPLRYQT